MDNVEEIIRKKPLLLLAISLGYLVLVGVLKWGIRPGVEAIYFAAGGLIGVYFLDVAEIFFKLTPSPFRSSVFAAGFAVVSFFIISSTDSLLGKGLVLSLYVTILLWQIGEWHLRGNLDSWYKMIAGGVTVQTQHWIMLALAAIFLVETYIFIV